jgi:uncharacterized protein
MTAELQEKEQRLAGILTELDSVLVAYSGGVDSTFLLKKALEVLGMEKVLAVVAQSDTYPASEVRQAVELASSLGAHLRLVHTNELNDENFVRNPINRCYYCKRELFNMLLEIARKEGYGWVAEGSNQDDLADFRPGKEAKEQLGVRSPLLEAGLTKQDIRALSKEAALPTWDKPSFACLSSRFPYGTRITPEQLRMVDEGEAFLKGLGFRQVRVRVHGQVARVELEPSEMRRLVQDGLASRVAVELKRIGFAYAALDLEGYRTGSMNEVLVEPRG